MYAGDVILLILIYRSEANVLFHENLLLSIEFFCGNIYEKNYIRVKNKI